MEEKIIIKSKSAISGDVVWGFGGGSLLIGGAGEMIFEGYYDLMEHLIATFLVSLLWMVPLCVLGACKMIVTDKRVYGITAFGRRVDLPIDSVSAIGTCMLSGIVVSTSSGQIKFYMIGNRYKMHNEISKMLIERQQIKKDLSENKVENNISEADELRKYKALLDDGIITLEEFEKKKKQLLKL